MKMFAWIVAVVLLMGCNSAIGNDSQTPARIAKVAPSDVEVRRALASRYLTPPGMQRECLGRLVFDVPAAIKWPTYASNESGQWLHSSFSKHVFDRGDGILIGDVEIGVLSPVTDETLGEMRLTMPTLKIAWLRQKIDEALKYVEKVRNSGMDATLIQNKIHDEEKAIRWWKERIAEMEANYETLSLPFADSDGFWRLEERDREGATYSIFRAYLRRGDFIYVFQSTVILNPQMTKERHHASFMEILRNFRPRKTNEIPIGLGICIPHGFIADDGKTITDIKQSMRFEDAPGVLYTIQTGNSTERNEKAALIAAIGTAMAGKVKSRGDARPRPALTQQILPHLTKIGELNASQGGFAIKISDAGIAPYEVYNVFTGYSGWRDVAVLPFILIEMSTRTMDQASELKQNPPPFTQSMPRLSTLLKSTRLRPTNPLMPDLASLSAKK